MASPLDRARSELDGLTDESRRLRERLSEVESEISDLNAFIKISERFAENKPAPAPNAGDPPLKRTITSILKDSDTYKLAPRAVEAFFREIHPFRGRGLPSATALILHKQQTVMTLEQITDFLLQRGFQFAAKNPEASVNWALNKASELSLVRKSGPSQWTALFGGPASDALKVELNTIPESAWEKVDPIEYVDKIAEDDRSGRTKAGLALARERGVRLGRPARLTEAHRELAAKMYAEGTKIADIAAACGVSKNGLSKRIGLWRREGNFPTREQHTRQKSPKPSEASAIH